MIQVAKTSLSSQHAAICIHPLKRNSLP